MLWQKPCGGAKTDPRPKFGEETMAEHTGGQNGFHIMVHKLTQSVLRMLRLYSGSAQALLRHAQALIRYAHPQLRLKQQLLTFGD
jgi:hypothetical protein